MYLVVLLCMIGQLTFSQNLMDGIVHEYFNVLKGESQFKQSDLSQWRITDVVPSLNPDIQHVYVQQLHNNIPIQYATYKLTVKNGKVTWHIDQFITNVAEKVATTQASLTPEAAVMKTVQQHQLIAPKLQGTRSADGTFVYNDSRAALEPIEVKQMYQVHNGEIRLVWNVSFYQKDGQHWWNENIDAVTGQVLRTEDWVITCNWGDAHENHNHAHESIIEEAPVVAGPANFMAGESYNVYEMPKESPLDGGRTIVTDPQNLTASPFGWHDTNGAAGAEYTITRGNNVWAQEDTNGNNGTGFSPDGGAGLDFDFPINLNNQPSTYQSAAITNLFYWNNIMHDVFYQYGFNEASGNFQENNYGNGGIGGDSVFADAQDGAGTNNANFSTPPDGGNGRMQMFLWTTANPQIDGDLDNGIIAHEYGHGISIRLVGGPGTNGLGGSEQMGEGWSDWFGLMLTMKVGDAGTDSRGIGNYALAEDSNGGGIRPTPYSTNTAINGTTYGDIGGLAVPHGVGYAYATILWDLTWALVAQDGFDTDFYNGTGGNNVAMALVIEGLKNTANNPGFVSGRDGMLQADQDLYGGQYNCIIWDVFAARGVGVDANENTNGGTNTNNDQTTSFTSGCGGGTPDACSGTVSSYPDDESFETNLGNWTQSTQDDLNWTRDSGGTPSNNTGPSNAADGTFYIYVEASGNGTGYPNKRAILNSPCYDLSGESGATFDFSYHMFGAADMGSIDLEVSTDDGATWTSIWNQTGNQGNQWNSQSINLNAYAGESNFRMRFNRVTGSTWQADIALDAFSMQGGSTPDTEAPSVPTNLAASNIADTTLTLTWNASTDNVGVTGYEVFQDGSSIATTANTTYNVTGLTAGTSYDFNVRAFDAAGNNSAQSNTASATTTGGGGGGCTGGVTVGYSEGFESSIGAWTQATGDDLNWTRDSGGTPSNNTGPSSGSGGSTWYMYVEASGNGTGYPNKQAILNSPCIDLSGETEADFTFDYHMFGSNDMGSIALEASTDGTTWTSIWSQTGNQGNQWNAQTVSLDAYAGGTVELRFNRITGGTWQADIAIDNVAVASGGGGGGNPPTGYCASNGNNTSDEYIQRVQIGSIDNSTGASAGGYGDFTNLSTNLSSSNSITITPLWTGTVYAEGYAVFVDWNRDGDFGDAGELAFSQTATTATPINGSFNVPAGASAGPTRMRVSMKYNDVPDPCESFSWGEVEDYIVVIPTSLQTSNGESSGRIISASEIFLYPNPVHGGLLNIAISDGIATEYEIYNVLGQLVVKGNFEETIDVSELQGGMYMLKIAVGNQSFVKNFIVD